MKVLCTDATWMLQAAKNSIGSGGTVRREQKKEREKSKPGWMHCYTGMKN